MDRTANFDGRSFRFQRASDSKRDGMGFEAFEGDDCVAELFYVDSDGRVTFTAFAPNLPLGLVQFMVTTGLEQITPVHGANKKNG